MNNNDYITQLISGDTGIVTEESHIQNIDDFLAWVNSNCHYQGIVNEQTIVEFTHQFKGLNKIRYAWINKEDFKEIGMQPSNVNEPAYNESKTIGDLVIIADDFVKRGEFWFCTTDEWMILMYGDDI